MTKKTKKLISEAYKNPKYSGRHVIIIGDEIHSRATGPAKSKLLEKLIEKYPKETPVIAYIPKEEGFILLPAFSLP